MSRIIVTSEDELRAIIEEKNRKLLASLIEHLNGTSKGNEGHYITKIEAANMLSCCIATIDNLARAQKLTRFYPFGGRAVRFLKSEVLALADKKK